jgi:hypothetical protein
LSALALLYPNGVSITGTDIELDKKRKKEKKRKEERKKEKK